MKRIVSVLVALLILLTVLFSAVGCQFGSGGSTVDPDPVTSIPWQIKTNKLRYFYGEEIEVEFLFSVSINGFPRKDGKTYCVKLAESDDFEIVGDNIVCTDGSEYSEEFKGERWWRQGPWGWRSGRQTYTYRVTFTIKVTENVGEAQDFTIYFKCMDDDWLLTRGSYYVGTEISEDPDYHYRINTYFSFDTNRIGIKFDDTRFQR